MKGTLVCRHVSPIAKSLCLGFVGFSFLVLAAQQPAETVYRLSFPAPQHRWLEVNVEFSDLMNESLHVRMSSASPGRYARHEFSKNIIDIAFTGAEGSTVIVQQRGTAHWEVKDHDGTVRVQYRIFGDRVDGTYFGVDSTHAHLNLPATLVWAEGLEARSIRVILASSPDGVDWNVATQLFPTSDSLIFTAPNLAYLLDSPIEYGPFSMRTFNVQDPAVSDYQPNFRVAVHHNGTSADLDLFTESIEQIVRETVTIFGEFPRFETDAYTFIADYLPTASFDAMEHRNSTVLTASGGIGSPADRTNRLGSVAHEFFHAWNVERIRPRSLEPFDFTDANVSGDLWLAEGVTNYYGALVLQRAGLVSLEETLDRFSRVINTTVLGAGRQLRSVVEMSRMAPFTDAATAIDPTNFDNTFISYYVWGEAIGLGLDLALRDYTGNQVSLDDYMRALWQQFGKPGGAIVGAVDNPYTALEAREVLGEVARSDAFAEDFFARYIDGRDIVDYEALFRLAGIAVQEVNPTDASLDVNVFGRGLRVARMTRYGSSLYEAGINKGDLIVSVEGQQVVSPGDLQRLMQDKRPGDRLVVEFRRDGTLRQTTIEADADRRIRLVAFEVLGEPVSSAQRLFRQSWLGSQQ
ncbi:MAG: M61 family metallopeptidase [Vicinamibacterales bacterium]